MVCLVVIVGLHIKHYTRGPSNFCQSQGEAPEIHKIGQCAGLIVQVHALDFSEVWLALDEAPNVFFNGLLPKRYAGVVNHFIFIIANHTVQKNPWPDGLVGHQCK
jgi:hypothetical protein